MNDMSKVIVPKSDQINADDLISGVRTIRITEVDIRPGTEQPVSIYFDGDDGKPWKPCKSMSRVLVAAWGPDAKAYVGRSVTLYRDPKVKWGGMEVGGIRISHLTDIEREMVMALTATKGKRSPYSVKPLIVQDDPAPRAKLTPEQWTDNAVKQIGEAFDSDALDALMKKLTPNANKLSASKPELFERVIDAERQARVALMDGPSGEQRGETNNDDPFELPPIENKETVDA